MKSTPKVTRSDYLSIALFTFFVGLAWVLGLFFIAADADQGDAYRIIYVHVPAAFTAFICAFKLLILGVLALRKRRADLLPTIKATSQMGLVFTAICLATGSIWGRPMWNVWWTWDPRLTTTLLLAIFFAILLIAYESIDEVKAKVKVCSILSILIAIQVPIIYKSVNWFRSLHQEQTLRLSGSTMDPTMKNLLLYSIAVTLLLGLTLIRVRSKQIQAIEEFEGQMIH